MQLPKFRAQPRQAGADLLRVRLLVNAILASPLPLEVLHDVCYVRVIAVDPGVLQRAIQQFACRADERLSFEILFVPGLLSHKDDARSTLSCAKDSLRGAKIEVTTVTCFCRLLQRGERLHVR